MWVLASVLLFVEAKWVSCGVVGAAVIYAWLVVAGVGKVLAFSRPLLLSFFEVVAA